MEKFSISGFHHGAIWIQFNLPALTEDHMLRFIHPHRSQDSLFILDSTSATFVPCMSFAHPTFRIDQMYSNGRVLVRLQNDGRYMDVRMQLSPENTFIYNKGREDVISGIFYGFLILIFLVNVFYFVLLKDNIFWIYALYVLANGFAILALNGKLNALFDFSTSGTYISLVAIHCWVLMLLIFPLYFLELNQPKSRPLKIIWAYIALLSIGAVLELLLVKNHDFSMYFAHGSYSLIPTIGLILYLMLKAYNQRKEMFKYYLIGMVIFMLTGITWIVMPFFHEELNAAIGSSLTMNTISNAVIKTGTLMEILVLSYGVTTQFRQTKERMVSEQLRNLKLQSMNWQLRLNPHFFFNSLNSISLFITNKDAERSRNYLVQFSKLMRKLLDRADQNLVSLDDEIEDLKAYVALEQQRFDHGFTFELNVDPTLPLEEIQVPYSLLQPYVENAIWHGLRTYDPTGKIELAIWPEDESKTSIRIRDNGQGRTTTLKTDEHKSWGTTIAKNRINTYNELFYLDIQVSYLDLKHADDSPAGTEVQLTFNRLL